MNPPETYRVLADYEVNDPHPLVLRAGDRVEVLKPDSGWPGWLWVRSGDLCGWMPEHYLDASAQIAHVVRNFDGTELSARRGDLLEVEESVAGWVYARSHASGNSGWFPLFNLRPAQS